MIKETREWFCDACGKKIEGYCGTISVIEFDDYGYPRSIGYDFCEDCMKSFIRWKDSRAIGNVVNEMVEELQGDDRYGNQTNPV